MVFVPREVLALPFFDVLHEIFGNWNLKLNSSCIFIDYPKAFDTIDHSILLQKLKIYALDDISLKILEFYLKNRCQHININSVTSSYSKLRCSVPQGSILGPLLFIIYTNDIFLEIADSDKMYMYADDTLLVNKGKDENVAVQNSQKSLIDKESLNSQRPKMELKSRNKVKFKQIFTNKSKVMNSPFNRGILLWNKLSSEIQKSKDVTTFKRMVRSLINSGQIMS